MFSYEGKCIAHGVDPTFVGLHLKEVLQRTQNTDVDGDELHKKFIAAAEAGGGWVSYAWRNDRHSSVRIKGSFIIKVKPQWGQELYAGVGYSLVPPPADEPASGLYGFVCTAKGGKYLAHASPAFVGRTLEEVVASTGNDQIDAAALLRKFRAAARLGGGWVTYPWRNNSSATLRQRGAYITKLERQERGTYCVPPPRSGASDGMGHSASAVASYDGDEPLLAGVGYFGEIQHAAMPPAKPIAVGMADATAATAAATTAATADITAAAAAAMAMPPLPPPIPPSHAAAKAATAALKAQLVQSSGSSLEALDAVVRDASGALAAAAAEVTCWEATELPPALAGLLKEHATGHLHAFGAATEGSEQFA